MNDTIISPRPYKGLMPYSEKDAPVFFGRDNEREIITANLRASRLTLLYGASGVGKSSVLQAGVVHHLRQLSQQNLTKYKTPEFAVVIFPNPEGESGETWRDDPLIGLTNCIHNSVRRALNVDALESLQLSKSFVENLRVYTERLDGCLLIILDQFEEYFIYPRKDREGTFAVEFPHAVNHPDLRVNFIISIRDDALAKLDYFQGRIPKLFGNHLRIKHLDREAAHKAIEEPVNIYDHISIEPGLADIVLDQITHVQANDPERGIVNRESTEPQIEAPYLQLVMECLWNKEREKNSHKLRRETLDELGGAEHIIRTHLDKKMSALSPNEQDVAARFFDYLVTSSGNKRTESVSDLAHWARLGEAQITPVLNKLCDPAFRILRPVAPPPNRPNELRYETFHDALAKPILDWKAHYEMDKKFSKTWERIKRLRKIIMFISGLAILIIGIIYWRNWQTKHKDDEARREHLKLLQEEFKEIVSDSMLILSYQGLLNTYPNYSGRSIVEATIDKFRMSENQFDTLRAIYNSDTLTIVQKLDLLKIFASSRRASPEKTYAEEKIRSLNALVADFASIDNLEQKFVTCRFLVDDLLAPPDKIPKPKLPQDIISTFSPGPLINVWAQIKSPRELERVTLRWYTNPKTYEETDFTIEKNLAEGYRIYKGTVYNDEGKYEVRLYNSRNVLIGRRVFYVVRQKR